MYRPLSPHRRRSRFALCAVLLIGGACLFTAGMAQGDPAAGETSVAATQAAATQATQVTLLSPQQRYGVWVLIPPIVTIVLAVVFRQVIPALGIGTLIAAFMMIPCLPVENALGGGL